MKNEILEIIIQHKFDHISSEQAVSKLLDLFDVVGQSEQLPCDECVDGERWSPYHGKYVKCDCRK